MASPALLHPSLSRVSPGGSMRRSRKPKRVMPQLLRWQGLCGGPESRAFLSGCPLTPAPPHRTAWFPGARQQGGPTTSRSLPAQTISRAPSSILMSTRHLGFDLARPHPNQPGTAGRRPARRRGRLGRPRRAPPGRARAPGPAAHGPAAAGLRRSPAHGPARASLRRPG
jgi:hypothetical protein